MSGCSRRCLKLEQCRRPGRRRTWTGPANASSCTLGLVYDFDDDEGFRTLSSPSRYSHSVKEREVQVNWLRWVGFWRRWENMGEAFATWIESSGSILATAVQNSSRCDDSMRGPQLWQGCEDIPISKFQIYERTRNSSGPSDSYILPLLP